MPLIKTADEIEADLDLRGGDTAPNTDVLWPTEDVTIEAAMQHPSPRVQKAAVRARNAMQDVRREIAEWDAAAELRVTQQRQREAVEAEVAAAQKALDDAKAKARDLGIGRAGRPAKAAASGRLSEAGKAAIRAGALKRAHTNGRHDAGAVAGCPSCEAA